MTPLDKGLHICSQAPGLFVEVFDDQYLPIPDTGVTPVKLALSAGLDYAPEPGSKGFSGALFKLAGQLTQFSMRFTGALCNRVSTLTQYIFDFCSVLIDF